MTDKIDKTLSLSPAELEVFDKLAKTWQGNRTSISIEGVAVPVLVTAEDQAIGKILTVTTPDQNLIDVTLLLRGEIATVYFGTLDMARKLLNASVAENEAVSPGPTSES